MKYRNIVIWPIVFLIGQFFITTIFSAFFTMRTNYEVGSELYENALSLFLKENVIWIGILSFIIFYPIFKKIYKKQKIKSKSINYSILPILILEILSIALLVHFLNSGINHLFSLSNRYKNQEIVWELLLSTVFLGPILEEYLFRGIVFERLKKKVSLYKAMFITSFCFSIMHGDILQMLYAFAVGSFLNYVYIKTQNIKIPIFLHCFLNGFFFIGNTILEKIPFYMQIFIFLLGIGVVYFCKKQKITERICKNTLDKKEEML